MAHHELQSKKSLNAAQKIKILIVVISTNNAWTVNNNIIPRGGINQLIDFGLHLLRKTPVKSKVFCSVHFRVSIKIHTIDFNSKLTGFDKVI